MTSPVLCISLRDLVPVEEPPRASVLCLGTFDGVHLAHRKLIHRTCQLRDEQFPTAAAAAFCFRTPPSDYLAKDPLPHLSSVEDKLRILQEEGLEYVFLADFPALKDLSPKEFATGILRDLCHCTAVVCGFNHRFGKCGAGKPDLFRELLNVPVEVLPEEIADGDTVSSTRIRRLLLEGKPEEAARLLTHPYTICSPIVHGKALGRSRGIPTLNQSFPPQRLIPRHGVYLSRCRIDGVVYYGISNVGTHPTVDEDAPINCETFLLDFTGDLYGKECEIAFLRFLRPEMTFPSTDALYRQIECDVEAARAYVREKTEKQNRS